MRTPLLSSESMQLSILFIRHLDRNDESEALLRDKLLLRVPPGVAEWRE